MRRLVSLRVLDAFLPPYGRPGLQPYSMDRGSKDAHFSESDF